MKQSATDARPNAGKSTRPRTSPAVDVVERPDDYRIFADMPGTTEAQIDITLDHTTLTVRAAIDNFAPLGMAIDRQELPHGEYFRRFEVGNDIDREGITASYRHGVLEITLPKAPQDQAKKITVRAGGDVVTETRVTPAPAPGPSPTAMGQPAVTSEPLAKPPSDVILPEMTLPGEEPPITENL